MDNQHKLIKGYRELSQAEIDLMNEIKHKAEGVSALTEKLREHLDAQYDKAFDGDPNDEIEQERLESANPFVWLSEGTHDIQVGFMKLVRSVAQPTTF